MFALEPLQAEHAEILKKHAGASPKGSPRAQGRLATAPGPLRCMSMCWDRAVHVSPATPACQPGAASARDKLPCLVGFTELHSTPMYNSSSSPALSWPRACGIPAQLTLLLSPQVPRADLVGSTGPSQPHTWPSFPSEAWSLRPGLRRCAAQPSLSIPISAGHGFSRRITDSIAALAACSRTKTWRC